MRYRELTPWVQDALVSYRGSMESLHAAQDRVRQRCLALQRMEGHTTVLTPERLQVLEATLAEVNALLITGQVTGAERVRPALNRVRQELEASVLLLQRGVREVAVTDELWSAIGQMQTILRAARGLTQQGSVRAAYPNRAGIAVGEAKDAFPECTFCPLRRTCPLKDLPILAEALGDVMFAATWLRKRYLPGDAHPTPEDIAPDRSQPQVELLDPAELLPLAEHFGLLAPDPEELVISREEEAHLEKMLCGAVGLTVRQWEAVRLCYLQGFTIREAAGKLGCNRSSLFEHLVAAERKVKQYRHQPTQQLASALRRKYHTSTSPLKPRAKSRF